MKNLPKISVIVPSFNQGRYLDITLRSILDQQYPLLELIVIDGGSTDECVQIIRKYEGEISYWCSEPDGGQCKGIIKGFSRATGEILCFLNSDDLFEPRTLHDVGRYFASHPNVDAVFGDSLWIDEEGNALRPQKEIPFIRFIWLNTHNYVPGMSMFWRSSIYSRVGGLNSSFQLAFDADLWIRFSDHGRIKHVRRRWSRMRFYPEQKNRRLRQQSDQEDMVIRSRYWKDGRVPKTYRLRRAVALTIRIAWKLVTGCYSIGYRRYLDRV